VMGVFVGGFAHALRWNLSEKRVCWQVHTLAGHSSGVASIDFSPDGHRIVSGSHDKLVKIWSAETGAEVSSFVGLRGGQWGDGGVLRCFRTFVALEVVSGEDGLAGVHTDRPLGRGCLCLFLPGRDARRERIA